MQVLSERMLRAVEADEERLIGSVKVGELPAGRPVLHRSDLMEQPRLDEKPIPEE